jgi:hypothetical protein
MIDWHQAMTLHPSNQQRMNWKMYCFAALGLSGTKNGTGFAAGIPVILNASRYVTVSKRIEHTSPIS